MSEYWIIISVIAGFISIFSMGFVSGYSTRKAEETK